MLSRDPPRLVYEKLSGTRDQVSLSTIYNIRRQKTGQPMTKKVVDTSQLDVVQRKQLSEFLASLSLPSAYLIRSGDFYAFVEGDIGAMYLKLNRGMCPLQYVAPFVSHPTFAQVKKIFQKETVWSKLDEFIEDFNKLLTDCSDLWHAIYSEAKETLDAEETEFPGITNMITAVRKEVHKGKETEAIEEMPRLSWLLDDARHRFVPLIYEDAVEWALGKNLTLIKKEDYDYGSSGEKQFVVRCQLPDHLATLIELRHEDKSIGFQLAASLRDAHIALRQRYRQSDQVKNLAEAMTQLELRRQNILRCLGQLASCLKPI